MPRVETRMWSVLAASLHGRGVPHERLVSREIPQRRSEVSPDYVPALSFAPSRSTVHFAQISNSRPPPRRSRFQTSAHSLSSKTQLPVLSTLLDSVTLRLPLLKAIHPEPPELPVFDLSDVRAAWGRLYSLQTMRPLLVKSGNAVRDTEI